MIIQSLTKRLNRTELETVLWTCHLSLLFTIGFSASLEEFSFLAVLSDHDRWKYFKESLQIKYSYIVHKHLLSLSRSKEIHLLDELLPTFPRWKCHLPPYGFLMSFSPFILIDHFLTYSNYLNNTNPHCFNSVLLGLQRLHQLPWTYYLLSINHGRNWYFSQTSLFVPFEVNITIKSKYSASGILDKLTTGQNLTAIPDKSSFGFNFFSFRESSFYITFR